VEVGAQLIFGSEIKALQYHPRVPREVDPIALGEVFTSWSALPPRTMFRNIRSLRPGYLLVLDADRMDERPYRTLSFSDGDALARR